MPPCPDGKEWSIENQQKDESSVLSFYRKMIRMRKSHPTLVGPVQRSRIDQLAHGSNNRSCMAPLRFSTSITSISLPISAVSKEPAT